MMMSADAEADLMLEEVVVTSDCSEDVQAEPESWLTCILDLEQAGKVEAADRQREALKEEFPDFKLP